MNNGGDEPIAILGNARNETVTIIWVFEHQKIEKTIKGNTIEVNLRTHVSISVV